MCMKKKPSFGNQKIAKKMTDRFGALQEKPFAVEMRYTDQVRDFVQKIETAHNEAASSTLVFR